ncbi:MAG: hemolysin III family protein [Planctomycetales bacterium]
MPPIQALPALGIREPFCSLSHLVGAVVFFVLAFELVRRGGSDRLRRTSLLLMSGATVLLLVTSGSYHLLWPGTARDFLVRADVSAVFLLIAGSMTPVHAILFQGLGRWLPLVAVWLVAFTGIALRFLVLGTVLGWQGVVVFLAFGWGGAFTTGVMWRKFGWKFVRPAVCAGLSYTVGAVVLMLHQPTLIDGVIGPHELWHAAVLAGLAFTWEFTFQFASGEIPGVAVKSRMPRWRFRRVCLSRLKYERWPVRVRGNWVHSAERIVSVM